LWHQGSDAELVRDAERQSLVTHGHIHSQLCCAFYCLWARRILEDDSDPWTSATTRMHELCPESRSDLDFVLQPRKPTGTGYVIDTLHSARWALEKGSSFEEVVRLAISLGHDTDTTACVAGGLAGIHYGLEGIPARWRTGLRGSSIVAPLLERLRAHIGVEAS
jgi:ADP-ribosylglycohydrolase